MAIERVSTLLKMADEANTSVIGFNCIDYNTVYAVCHAAEIAKHGAKISSSFIISPKRYCLFECK